MAGVQVAWYYIMYTVSASWLDCRYVFTSFHCEVVGILVYRVFHCWARYLLNFNRQLEVNTMLHWQKKLNLPDFRRLLNAHQQHHSGYMLRFYLVNNNNSNNKRNFTCFLSLKLGMRIPFVFINPGLFGSALFFLLRLLILVPLRLRLTFHLCLALRLCILGSSFRGI